MYKNGISNLNEIIMGGDWNVVRDIDLDEQGGICNLKQHSVDHIDSIMIKFNLNDSWRIKHPQTKCYTWRQTNPLIQCR